MAENFPDDSLFRTSNVAYLEYALNEKEKYESHVEDGKDLRQSGITRQVSVSNELGRVDYLECEYPIHGVQPKKAPYLSAGNNEESIGFPKPQIEEIKFLSFDFNDLSNVMEEYSQRTNSRKILEERNVSILPAHILSEQNPSTTCAQLKSISCNGTETSSFENSEEKSTSSKDSLRCHESHSSGYSSMLTATSKKGKSGKYTESKTIKTEKSVPPEDRSKSEQSKKKGYQPLQLNITKTFRHDDSRRKKKTSPESIGTVKWSPKKNLAPISTEILDKRETNVRLNSIKSCYSLNVEALSETSSETSASNTTNSIDDTVLTTQQRLQLESWGFPETILKQYARRGVTQMFPWQIECLCQPNVLRGGNLVYSAPTSAGSVFIQIMSPLQYFQLRGTYTSYTAMGLFIRAGYSHLLTCLVESCRGILPIPSNSRPLIGRPSLY